MDGGANREGGAGVEPARLERVELKIGDHGGAETGRTTRSGMASVATTESSDGRDRADRVSKSVSVAITERSRAQ